MLRMHPRHAVEQHYCDTGKNESDQGQVEQSSGARVGLENHGVHAQPPAGGGPPEFAVD